MVRFPAKDKLKRFGEPGTDDHQQKLAQYRTFIVDKLYTLTQRFISSIKANLHCFPPSIAWLVGQVFSALSRSGNIDQNEVCLSLSVCLILSFSLSLSHSFTLYFNFISSMNPWVREQLDIPISYSIGLQQINSFFFSNTTDTSCVSWLNLNIFMYGDLWPRALWNNLWYSHLLLKGIAADLTLFISYLIRCELHVLT